MVNRSILVVGALLFVTYGAAGRTLKQNGGVIVADTRQRASNSAVRSNDVNQANANQNAQAAGNGAAASNSAAVDQDNDDGRRKLLQNGGVIVADTRQRARNSAVRSNDVNQANANQNAQAAGNGAAAGNSVAVDQDNDDGRRKLLQNGGVIVADTRQRASNSAVDSNNVNQANANQNAQAAGNGASASNSAAVDQDNGDDGRRKLLQNGGVIVADTRQRARNSAVRSNDVNQANANQNAQAAGNGAAAGNSVAVDQDNDDGRRKLLQNGGVIVADTRQRASNSAVDSNNVNQANANQNAQAAGNGASASNSAAVAQDNGNDDQ